MKDDTEERTRAIRAIQALLPADYLDTQPDRQVKRYRSPREAHDALDLAIHGLAMVALARLVWSPQETVEQALAKIEESFSPRYAHELIATRVIACAALRPAPATP